MLHIHLTVLVLTAGSAFAQTSLFIPGFDPQPLSADILGVDPQGRTTWALHPGSPTDTFGAAGFVGTATLVEGPNDASLTYVAPEFTMGIACTLSDTLAICSASSSGTVATATETVSRFAVQGGTTASATPTGTTTTPQSSQPSQTSSKTAAPSSTSNARKFTPYIPGLFVLTTLVAVLI